MVKFKTSKKDMHLIRLIAKRTVNSITEFKYNLKDCEMDITACHCNGCELDLDKLISADDFNFLHDVLGIRKHIDRSTGKLKDCFLPRSSR